ncbi:MAG: DUF421 domain-containing protein [Clostridia bacterium]|nr:DUF421 domain-containing protein [Clostridia bacterium]
MTTLLIRTVLIYAILVFAMRMMGKRQIGELEISDLVTTLLISEIASLPITDNDIPLSHAVVPIVTLITFEVVSSALLAAFPRLKNILTTRPATLIRNGKLCGKEMKNARISADELISELRQKDIADPSEVAYAILEQNGKITVLPKAKNRPPSAEQLKIKVQETGLYHIVIDKGCINAHNLKELNLKKSELLGQLSKQGLRPRDIYLMMINDTGDTQIIKKSEV